MPYFTWRGIDLNGIVRTGQLGSQSVGDLDKELLEQNVALFSAKPVRHWPLRSHVSLEKKVTFFNQLSILLNSGIYLDKALTLLHDQNDVIRLKEAVYDVAMAINEGNSLSQSLSKYKKLFSPVMIHMVNAGEESGKLAIGLQNLADYLQERSAFEQKVRGALLLPVLTFIFFLAIALTIFVFIVPIFASMFTTSGQKLPEITQLMMKISDIVSSKKIFILLGCIAIVSVSLKKIAQNPVYEPLFDSLWLKIPLVGSLLRTAALSSFLQSFALLVQSSVHVVPALKMAQETVDNVVLKERVVAMTEQIEGGQTINYAMEHAGIFFNDARAMVSVGEESGKLGLMLQKATDMYKHRVNKSVAMITTLLQPLLMIVLGVLILGLVFAIYLPIFKLSNVVS